MKSFIKYHLAPCFCFLSIQIQFFNFLVFQNNFKNIFIIIIITIIFWDSENFSYEEIDSNINLYFQEGGHTFFLKLVYIIFLRV